MGKFLTDYDLSPIWIAAYKSPIVEDRPQPVPIKIHGVEYLAFRPLALRAMEPIPVLPKPNFQFSQSTFSARNPFLVKRQFVEPKKPSKTALEQLKEALVRCHNEQVDVNRMQSVWNFELIRSVTDA
jgi:hypothetical protein